MSKHKHEFYLSDVQVDWCPGCEKSELDIERERTRKAVEVLRFYADEDNYSGCHASGWRHIHMGNKEPFQAARDVLKELGEA